MMILFLRSSHVDVELLYHLKSAGLVLHGFQSRAVWKSSIFICPSTLCRLAKQAERRGRRSDNIHLHDNIWVFHTCFCSITFHQC